MSAGRSHRRAAARYRQAEMLREAHAAPVSSVRRLDARHDLVTKGPAVFVLPSVIDAMPAELKNAIARRRQAALTGHCACGARRSTLPSCHGVRHEVYRHEHDCPASDESIAEISRRLGWRWV